jgi:hypothetical protein
LLSYRDSLLGRQAVPVVFNLVEDAGESKPLDATCAEYAAALSTINAAKAAHLATITPGKCDR